MCRWIHGVALWDWWVVKWSIFQLHWAKEFHSLAGMDYNKKYQTFDELKTHNLSCRLINMSKLNVNLSGFRRTLSVVEFKSNHRRCTFPNSSFSFLCNVQDHRSHTNIYLNHLLIPHTGSTIAFQENIHLIFKPVQFKWTEQQWAIILQR